MAKPKGRGGDTTAPADPETHFEICVHFSTDDYLELASRSRRLAALLRSLEFVSGRNSAWKPLNDLLLHIDRKLNPVGFSYPLVLKCGKEPFAGPNSFVIFEHHAGRVERWTPVAAVDVSNEQRDPAELPFAVPAGVVSIGCGDGEAFHAVLLVIRAVQEIVGIWNWEWFRFHGDFGFWEWKLYHHHGDRDGKLIHPESVCEPFWTQMRFLNRPSQGTDDDQFDEASHPVSAVPDEIMGALDSAAAVLENRAADIQRREERGDERTAFKLTLDNDAIQTLMNGDTDSIEAVKGTLPRATPPPREERPEASPKLGLEERGLAILISHPTWTNTRIAKELGCDRTTLYTWTRFKQARELQKLGRKELPRGAKSKSGNVEAWDTDADQ